MPIIELYVIRTIDFFRPFQLSFLEYAANDKWRKKRERKAYFIANLFLMLYIDLGRVGTWYLFILLRQGT